VGVEFLLGEHITAGLAGRERKSAAVEIRGSGAKWLYGAVRARQIKEAYFAGEGNHCVAQ
jgi:stage V sporulation protein SpoVS